MSHNKNWMVIFKKNFDGIRDPLHVTKEKADVIREFLNDKKSDYIDLTGDNGDYVETIKKNEITGIKQRVNEGLSKTSVWICDCGRRNPMHVWPTNKCECKRDRTKLAEKWLANNKDR